MQNDLGIIEWKFKPDEQLGRAVFRSGHMKSGAAT
jgi:hypothetical protein